MIDMSTPDQCITEASFKIWMACNIYLNKSPSDHRNQKMSDTDKNGQLNLCTCDLDLITCPDF